MRQLQRYNAYNGDNGNICKEWGAQRDSWNDAMNTIRGWLRQNPNINITFN